MKEPLGVVPSCNFVSLVVHDLAAIVSPESFIVS